MSEKFRAMYILYIYKLQFYIINVEYKYVQFDKYIICLNYDLNNICIEIYHIMCNKICVCVCVYIYIYIYKNIY